MTGQIITDVRAFLQQYTEWPIGLGPNGQPRPLCREDYDWSSVQIKLQLDNDTQSDDETYNGPKNFHSLIFGVQAHIGINDLSDEKLAISNIGNPGIEERHFLQAQNIKIELENLDKQGGAKLFHNAPKRLSSLLKGIWLPIPILVQNADSLKVTCTRVDEATDVAASDIDVGVDLWLIQVRSGP